MARLAEADLQRMTSSLFIDGAPVRGRAASRFWVLLVLAAAIASAGLVADSVATVIGAMIVAPLMTPILGTALGIVFVDRTHIVRSVAYVVVGALVVIAIGFAFSVVFAPPDLYASNVQVAARISPRLIDLVAALATGLVGAFALSRSDISDTLPGVAIAISLVPPLAVCGMLIEVGRYADSAHALLLFGTNVAAIIASGTIVFLVYGVRSSAVAAGLAQRHLPRKSLVVVALAVVAVAIPLGIGTVTVARDEALSATAEPLARQWAGEGGWIVTDVSSYGGRVVVRVVGAEPAPEPMELRHALDAAGYETADLAVLAVHGIGHECPAGAQVCATSVVADE